MGFLSARAIEDEAQMVGRAIEPLFESVVDKNLPRDARRLTKKVADFILLESWTKSGWRLGMVGPERWKGRQGSACRGEQEGPKEQVEPRSGKHGEDSLWRGSSRIIAAKGAVEKAASGLSNKQPSWFALGEGDKLGRKTEGSFSM
jgi:hypothetical protein